MWNRSPGRASFQGGISSCGSQGASSPRALSAGSSPGTGSPRAIRLLPNLTSLDSILLMFHVSQYYLNFFHPGNSVNCKSVIVAWSLLQYSVGSMGTGSGGGYSHTPTFRTTIVNVVRMKSQVLASTFTKPGSKPTQTAQVAPLFAALSSGDRAFSPKPSAAFISVAFHDESLSSESQSRLKQSLSKTPLLQRWQLSSLWLTLKDESPDLTMLTSVESLLNSRQSSLLNSRQSSLLNSAELY